MKSSRHLQILRLIRENEIGTQEELARKLNESGYPVTQATVSRDIRALNLLKVPAKGGGMRYTEPSSPEPEEEQKYIGVLKEAYLSMDTASNLLVVRTAPGMAMAAAAVLDAMRLEEVVGCIAGDNTIMCATHSEKDAENLMRELREMLGENG